MSASAREVLAALDRAEEPIRDAFLQYVREIVDDARLLELERLILEGAGMAAIVAALGITREALAGVVEAVRSAFASGGALEAGRAGRGAARVRLRFDIGNPAAERWLRLHGAQLVTNVLADQVQAIRSTLTLAMEAGRGPRSVALDIVGRLDRSTGRRVGGIVGLTDQQAQYVANARRELGALDRGYFSRQRRDKRFDSIVMRAIRDGKPLSEADVDRIVGRYSDRLLAYRGEMIGRTESLQALNAGRDETWRQAIEAGQIRAENVEGVWKSAVDSRVRDTHAAMHNQRVKFGVPFVSPSGARLLHPGDTSLGAGASEIVACRCVKEVVVDWIAQEIGNG